MHKKRVGFIGAGKMATALISRIYNKKTSKSIIVSNRDTKDLINIKKQFKIKITKDNKAVVQNSDIVFICVKPQDIDIVINEINNTIKNQLIVSIAAGIKLNHIESILKNKRIIRVMPNINCMVGEMAASISAGRHATQEDINDILNVLKYAGISFLLKEDLLDAVTAISGSGPAFFAYFIKAFEEAGIKNGLPKEVAFTLAAQTALGTGKLLMNKNLSVDELIAIVASKRGTTLAGLRILKKYNADEIIMETINSSIKRSKELGKLP